MRPLSNDLAASLSRSDSARIRLQGRRTGCTFSIPTFFLQSSALFGVFWTTCLRSPFKAPRGRPWLGRVLSVRGALRGICSYSDPPPSQGGARGGLPSSVVFGTTACAPFPALPPCKLAALPHHPLHCLHNHLRLRINLHVHLIPHLLRPEPCESERLGNKVNNEGPSIFICIDDR